MKYLVMLVIALMLVGGTAKAESQPDLLKDYFQIEVPEPSIDEVPYIQEIKAAGATLHYLGTRSGLAGFLVVKDAQIQVVYISKDKKSVIMGGMFTDQGDLISPLQLELLSKKNQNVADILSGKAHQRLDVIKAGMAKGGIAEVSGNADLVNTNIADLPLLPTSPGERLVADLTAAAGVVLGDKKAPELLMVVAPNCKYCKKTWEGVKDAVEDGKIHVRLIPIARSFNGDTMRLAARLLRVSDPLKAWNRYLVGDKSLLVGEADNEAYHAIVSNMTITDRWNIVGVPYLVYRSKKDTIKIVQGKPERMATILLDLVR